MKAQATLEFALLFLIALGACGLLILFLQQEQTTHEEELHERALQEFARYIQKEIIVASHMHTGFARNLTLPTRIGGLPYTIWVTENNLYLAQDDYEIIIPLPPVSGTISGTVMHIEVDVDRVVVS
jgi:hypothetical protein